MSDITPDTTAQQDFDVLQRLRNAGGDPYNAALTQVTEKYRGENGRGYENFARALGGDTVGGGSSGAVNDMPPPGPRKPSQTEGVIDRAVTRVGRDFQQVMGGFVETFGSSPAAREELPLGIGYVTPNVLYGLYGLAGAAIDEYGGVSIPGYETSLRYAQSGIEGANELADTTDPEGTRDMLFRVVGSMLVPVPVGGAAATTGGRAAQAIARGVIPGAQSKTAAGLAVEAGIGTTIGDVISDVADPRYEGIADALTSGEAASISGDIDLDSTSVQVGPKDYTAEFGLGLLALGAASAAGAAARYAGNRLAARQTSGEFVGRADTIPASPDVSTGTTINENRLSPRSTARSRWQRGMTNAPLGGDASTPIRAELDALDKRATVSAQDLQTARDWLTSLSSPQSLERRAQDFMTTGQFPESRITSDGTVRAFYNDMADQLDGPRKAQLDDAIIEASKYEQLQREVSAGTRVPQTQQLWGNRTLRDPLRVAQSLDPQQRELFYRYFRMMQSHVDYLHEAGMIDAATFRDWKANRQYYAYASLNAPGAFDADPLAARSGIDEGIMPGEFARPTDQLANYSHGVIAATERARVQRKLLELFEQGGATAMGPNGRMPLVQRVKSGKQGTATMVVPIDGRRVTFRVNDQWLKAALEFQPSLSVPYLRTIRRIGQFMTTGPGNPLFAPTTMSWEAIMAPMMTSGGVARRAGAFFSPLTGLPRYMYGSMVRGAAERFRRIAANPNGRLSSIIGQQRATDIADRMANAYANSTLRLYERYGGGGSLYIDWGPGDRMPNQLAEIAPDYIKRFGMQDQIPSEPFSLGNLPSWLMGEASGAFTNISVRSQASMPWRLYSEIQRAFHEAVRIETFRTGIGRDVAGRGGNVRYGITPTRINGTVTPVLHADNPTLTKAAAEARSLVGDPGQVTALRGSPEGRVIQGLLSVTPYAHVASQAMRQLARRMKRDPAGTIGAMTSMGGLLAGGLFAQFAMNEDAKEYYWQRMTPSQRARLFPFFNSDGSVAYYMSLPHEFRMFWAPFIEGLGALSSGTRANEVGVEAGTAASTAFARVFLSDIMPDYLYALRPAATVSNADLGEFANLSRGRSLLGDRFVNPYTEDETYHRIIEAVGELFLAGGQNVYEAVRTYEHARGDGTSFDDATTKAFQDFAGRTVMRPSATGTQAYHRIMPAAAADLSLASDDYVTQYYDDAKEALERLSTLGREMLTATAGSPAGGFVTQAPGFSESMRRYGQLIGDAHTLNRSLDNMFGSELQTLYRELNAIQTNPHLSPQEKQARSNATRQRILDAKRIAFDDVRQMERQIGRTYGDDDFSFRWLSDQVQRR